ncbi:DNA mismatch repair protein [Dichotomocladium elegans]|nr:DNA mismatch repair protein [Dichotomocladium elegans]
MSDTPVEEPGKPEQVTFAKFFRSLEETEGLIRLFERDANQRKYYSVHGENALYVADHVFNTHTVLKYWGGDDGLPTATMTSTVAGSFVRDALLKKQLRVEFWESNRGHWQMTHNASPGNLQAVEEFLFAEHSMTVSPVVMAIKLSSRGNDRVVGVAFANATNKELGVAEFVDNEMYSNLEAFAIQLSVKECLMAPRVDEKDYDYNRVRCVLDLSNIVVSEQPKSEFNTKNVEYDLKRLLRSGSSDEILSKKNALSACACLINYLKLGDDTTNAGQFELKDHRLNQYMRLGASALTALNLMPSPREGTNKTMSLYGLLNRCVTAQGSRLLMQWLRQPLLNIDEIVLRQDIVEIFCDNIDIRSDLRGTHLKKVPDLHRLAKKFARGVASLQDVVRVDQFIHTLESICNTLCAPSLPEDAMTVLAQNYSSALKEYFGELNPVSDYIEATIDMDAIENHEYRVRAEQDERLLHTRSQMDTTMSEMKEVYEEVVRDLGIIDEKKIKFERHNTYNYCFRVNKTEASKLRNKRNYYELSTQKSGTYFTTADLQTLNNRHKELENEYYVCQQALAKEVIEQTANCAPTLEVIGGILSHMDALLSFAEVSMLAPEPYVRPTMQTSGALKLQKARHPCLEAQDGINFIANDVMMERDTAEFQIITGPNMGGKSTYIRQIGVIALMAQVGCFVPCEQATLPIFDCILARVGAGDSPLKGVSTFMAEMLETANILKSATSNSLIIIDELGRGTSTYDGFGLAWAISDYITTKIRAYTLFATHFHELTALANTVPHVKNLNVAVQIDPSQDGNNRLTLLYQVREGVCSQSFGIHVAEMADFPQSVIKLAKRKVAELEDSADQDITTKYPRHDVQSGNLLLRELAGELRNAPEPLIENVRVIAGKYRTRIDSNAYLKELLGYQ